MKEIKTFNYQIEQSLKDSIECSFSWKEIAGLRDKISYDYRLVFSTRSFIKLFILLLLFLGNNTIIL